MLLIAGSFLEPPAAILILTPLLLPVVEAAGINALHFGIIMAVNLSIGLYMPPSGLNPFCRSRHLRCADERDLPRRSPASISRPCW